MRLRQDAAGNALTQPSDLLTHLNSGSGSRNMMSVDTWGHRFDLVEASV